MYDEFEDYDDFDNSDEIREAAERARASMIVKAINENYTKLVTKGFSGENVERWGEREIQEMMETLTFMIQHFEEDEEYEKCANLVRARECLIAAETFRPVM